MRSSVDDLGAKNWLEVCLTVDGEMAEAVAEVLARYLPNGVVIESTAVNAPLDGSAGGAVGPLRVMGYIPVDHALDETRQKIEEALWYLGRIRPLPQAQYRPVGEEDWSAAWKAHYQPIAVGSKLIIVPAWLETQNEARIPIRIDPGMAFGTGTHPSTQMCLEFIEDIMARRMDGPGRNAVKVIDVGCGSGILSIAALKLGAREALGVDIDRPAVLSARENAELNQVSEQLELGQGSVAEILAAGFRFQEADIVLANILAPVIIRLLEAGLGDLLAEGGDLVLAGIIEAQAAEVESALKKHGLAVAGRKQIDDWVALHVRQP